MKSQATSTDLPIVLECIYHGQIVEEILIKVDVESLRDEWREWAPRVIDRPHPQRPSSQVHLGGRAIGIGQIQQRGGRRELLCLTRRRGVHRNAVDIVRGVVRHEAADVQRDLVPDGVERYLLRGLDTIDCDRHGEVSCIPGRVTGKVNGGCAADPIVYNSRVHDKHGILGVLLEVRTECWGAPECEKRFRAGGRQHELTARRDHGLIGHEVLSTPDVEDRGQLLRHGDAEARTRSGSGQKQRRRWQRVPEGGTCTSLSRCGEGRVWRT